jgi:hypothetical protein
VQIQPRIAIQLPRAGLGDGGRGLRPLVPGISEDTLDEGKEAACAPIEDEQSAVAILHSGRVDDHVLQQAERVDQGMPFSAGDLLGRVKPKLAVQPHLHNLQRGRRSLLLTWNALIDQPWKFISVARRLLRSPVGPNRCLTRRRPCG